MIRADGTRACACGAVHVWAALPVYAIWSFDDGGPSLLLKNCAACSSTIAEEIPVPPPTLSSTLVEVSP